MKENWTNDIRLKLEGHKMMPPAGLWEGISSELGLHEEPAPKTVAIKQWFWTTAAIVLALVGFFVIYQFNQHEPLPQASHTSQIPEPPIMSGISPESQQLALADISQHTKTKVTPKIPVGVSQPKPIETNQEIPEETNRQVSEEEGVPHSDPQVGEPQQASVATSHHTSSETYNHAAAHYQTKQVSASTSTGKWSIGLNASGGLLASSSHNHTDRLFYYSDYNPTDMYSASSKEENKSSKELSYTQTNFVSEHHLPVCLGISLHYQLNPRLALLSGINYTYLYSEFSIPLYPNIHSDQKLHYLGIPVGLSWQLWKTNGFSLYLSGSAMLEKCLNEKPWQWSLSAAAGAEYAITPLFGLYLEPSLGYYFSDGTSFEHYYKKHPLAPSIEFGLRLHISGK